MNYKLRTPVFVFAFCLSMINTAIAAPNYARTATLLSEAMTQYKLLSESHEKYDVAFRRDPMKPLVDAQGNIQSASGLKDGLWVQGIIWSEERPLVVIEDDLFAKGDVLDDYTIREIRQDGVVVERGTETKFIPIDRGIPTP